MKSDLISNFKFCSHSNRNLLVFGTQQSQLRLCGSSLLKWMEVKGWS